MNNPVTLERAEPSAGAAVAAVAAARRPRAVSADSFRLLTAKLKGATASAAPPPGPNVTAQPDAVPADAVEPAPLATGYPVPQSVEEPPPATLLAEPAPEEAVSAALLPDFAPISPHLPELAAGLPDFPAFETAPGVHGPGWQHDPLPPIESLFGPPVADEQPVEEAQTQPLAASIETCTVEEAVVQPLAAPDVEQPAGVIAETAEEPILPHLDIPEAEPEPEAVFQDAEPEMAPQDEAPTPKPAAAEAELEAPQTSIAEPEVAVAGEQVVHPVAKAEDQENPETKTRASEMAGRVVDAMIKTISTAIYAKPSAAERAAFLREMASFMADAANESDASAVATAVPAASPPMPSVRVVATDAAAAVPPIAEEAPAALAVPQDVPPPARPAPLAEDPFTEPPPRLLDPRPLETPEADGESGELALTLLDMMSGGSSSLPHERTLAADTLLRILPRIPVKQLIAVVERVAIMETPPALLVARLIRDARPEIVGPLLERCSQISDQDLMNAAPDHDTAKLRMIARRRTLSTVLSDYLIATGEPGVLLTLIRNPAAAISHDAFFKLAEFASRHPALLAPLATRADLPPPVAFELFWHVPQELRRFIFSRFLTDSETLNKILRITLATHAADGNEDQTEAKFPTREALDEALATVSAFKLDAAAVKLAELARVSRDTAMRILCDREGEPLTVLMKTLGCARARFEEVLQVLRRAEDGVLRPDRKPEELQAIFDSLSFNKARILLTYWDWYVRKSGPYAPQN